MSQIDRRKANSKTLSSEPSQVYREGDEDFEDDDSMLDDDDFDGKHSPLPILEGSESHVALVGESDDDLLNDDDDEMEEDSAHEMEDASD